MPGACGDDELNLWRGFKLPPRRALELATAAMGKEETGSFSGDVIEFVTELVQPLLLHIKEEVGGGG